MNSKVLIFALILANGYSECHAAVEVIQDGNYILEYNLINGNTTLAVTATVRAVGWVGVGLSETDGSMVGADLIIGGVRNGNQSYAGDYFSQTNSRPIEDIEDNILSFSATENSTHTILTFTRLADTGDEYEDLPLARATHIIWAYHPSSDSLTNHGSANRGSFANPLYNNNLV